MRADVSVIMPAYGAAATVARAARSVFAQEGVSVELVLCADDHLDYAAVLAPEARAGDRLTLCRTPVPRSGPSRARNTALGHAQAGIIAALDADDAYAPDRLRRLLPLVEKHGVATGPTLEIGPGSRVLRVARPRQMRATLAVEDICELRMPFSPVYQRALCPAGWPEVGFAEDVILNVDLHCATGGYGFAEEAGYLYQVGQGSRTGSAQALQDARAGYLQILELVGGRNWPPAVKALVQRVFSEDLAAVERAMSADAGPGSWRAAVRDGPGG
jgi:glycosyltransferase involved in cell wall biosynthesis